MLKMISKKEIQKIVSEVIKCLDKAKMEQNSPLRYAPEKCPDGTIHKYIFSHLESFGTSIYKCNNNKCTFTYKQL